MGLMDWGSNNTQSSGNPYWQNVNVDFSQQVPSINTNLGQFGDNLNSSYSLRNTGRSSLLDNSQYDMSKWGNPAGGNNPQEMGWFQKYITGGKDSLGNSYNGIAPFVGLAKGGMDAYLGYQQLKLAKEALSFQKDAFSKQFENQRTLTNAQLRDRQRARNSSAGGHQSEGAYMAQNGV